MSEYPTPSNMSAEGFPEDTKELYMQLSGATGDVGASYHDRHSEVYFNDEYRSYDFDDVLTLSLIPTTRRDMETMLRLIGPKRRAFTGR